MGEKVGKGFNIVLSDSGAIPHNRPGITTGLVYDVGSIGGYLVILRSGYGIMFSQDNPIFHPTHFLEKSHRPANPFPVDSNIDGTVLNEIA